MGYVFALRCTLAYTHMLGYSVQTIIVGVKRKREEEREGGEKDERVRGGRR